MAALDAALLTAGHAGVERRSCCANGLAIRRDLVSEKRQYNPEDYPHPGAALLAELQEIGLSQRTFAKYIGVPEDVVERLCSCQIPMTAVLACKIGCALGSLPRQWMELQINYDLVRVDDEEFSAIKPLGEYSSS